MFSIFTIHTRSLLYFCIIYDLKGMCNIFKMSRSFVEFYEKGQMFAIVRESQKDGNWSSISNICSALCKKCRVLGSKVRHFKKKGRVLASELLAFFEKSCGSVQPWNEVALRRFGMRRRIGPRAGTYSCIPSCAAVCALLQFEKKSILGWFFSSTFAFSKFQIFLRISQNVCEKCLWRRPCYQFLACR